MKKLLLLLLSAWFLGGLPGLAQPKGSGEPQKLIKVDGQYFMQPRWSPDGAKIGFAGEKYNSIWVTDAQGHSLKKITGDFNAGFGFAWSQDGKSILARPSKVENHRQLYMVKLYDADSGDETLLQAPSANLKHLPVWADGDTRVAMVLNHQLHEVATGKPALKSSSMPAAEVLKFNGELVSGVAGGKNNIEFPQFSGRYLFNLKSSPSGKKVVFQVNGLGLYLSNSDGTNLVHLGQGEQASWMPGEKYVVVTQVEDDGEVITKGELFAVDVATGTYFPLMANPQVIALNPAVSPDGSELLFNNPADGAIYLLKLQK